MGFDALAPSVPTEVDFSEEDATSAPLEGQPSSNRIDARRIELGKSDVDEKRDDDNVGIFSLTRTPRETGESRSDDEMPLVKRKRQRRKVASCLKMTADELLNKVKQLLYRMETAAGNDLESNAQRQPAIEKLKMLDEVEEACIHREMQPMLLSEGLLGVLKSWIEPLNDGTLPNLKIRTTVLKILQKLPIDTANPPDRENLKTSQIGSRVMFLSRIPDETAKNRRLASELVQRWSRPIFEDARRYDEQERVSNALKARKRRLETERIEDEKRKMLKPGDPEFRYVAMRPQPSRDYVIEPKSSVDPGATAGHKKDMVLKRINRLKRDRRRS